MIGMVYEDVLKALRTERTFSSWIKRRNVEIGPHHRRGSAGEGVWMRVCVSTVCICVSLRLCVQASDLYLCACVLGGLHRVLACRVWLTCSSRSLSVSLTHSVSLWSGLISNSNESATLVCLSHPCLSSLLLFHFLFLVVIHHRMYERLWRVPAKAGQQSGQE